MRNNDSPINSFVRIINAEDEHGNYDQKGQIIGIVKPTPEQRNAGYTLVNYVVQINNQNFTYIREEFKVLTE